MTTFPLSTLACTVDATGISSPSFADILSSLTASYQLIYGSDVYLAPDSQDGQLLAIFAQAIYNSNQMAIFVYNQFSPATAQGAGLSSVVKINGLDRLKSSQSTAIVDIVGQPGTIITNGLVGDNLELSTQWALPATVTIPPSGLIEETATCTVQGAVLAVPGSLSVILTPTRGWQTVTNLAAASPGAPVELDATLRRRQTISTSLPAQTVIGGILGSVSNLPGVVRCQVYDNDTGATDINGIPPRSIAVVVQGGDAVAIASAIAQKKTPGTGTFGFTSELTLDSKGVPVTIKFAPLIVTQIDVVITIKALAGYLSTTGPLIQGAVSAFLNTLQIGEASYTFRLASPANLNGPSALLSTGLTQDVLSALGETYHVTAITQARHGAPQASFDIPILFNEAAFGTVANITLVVS